MGNRRNDSKGCINEQISAVGNESQSCWEPSEEPYRICPRQILHSPPVPLALLG